MRKRDAGPRGGETRLAYSTGGDTEAAPAAAASPRAGGGKGIRLRLETRPGGRVVTLVLGLAGTDAEIALLAKALKSVCGAGGTVKDGVVELQGDHRTAAQAALAARGLKARI
jgi:translation initiation factor 1